MELIAETPRRRGTPETASISGNGYSITEYGRFERRGSRGKRGLEPRESRTWTSEVWNLSPRRRDAEEHQKQPAFRAMATVSPNMVGLSAEGAEVNVGCRRERAELGVGKHGIYRRDAETPRNTRKSRSE